MVSIYLFVDVAILGLMLGLFIYGKKLGIIWKLAGYLFVVALLWLSWQISGLFVKIIDLTPLASLVIGPVTSVVNKFFGQFDVSTLDWNRLLICGIIFLVSSMFLILKQPIKNLASKSSLKFPLSFTIGSVLGLLEGLILVLFIYKVMVMLNLNLTNDLIDHTLFKFVGSIYDYIMSVLQWVVKSI